jgi:hypothetical protein
VNLRPQRPQPQPGPSAGGGDDGGDEASIPLVASSDDRRDSSASIPKQQQNNNKTDITATILKNSFKLIHLKRKRKIQIQFRGTGIVCGRFMQVSSANTSKE